MESTPPSTDHSTRSVVLALCTATSSSLTGVYIVTTSIPVTIIAAVASVGLSAAYFAFRR
jgi:hypothetical protein